MANRYRSAVLLGLFDSVHIGHQKTLEVLAKSDAAVKTVYTFDLASLDTKGERVPLISDSEREKLLLANGAHRVVSEDFKTVKGLSCEEFFKSVLIDRLGADMVICGKNYRFGKNAEGDTDTLARLCRKYGITLNVVGLENIDGEVVSTTRIRHLLALGDIPNANRLLGRSYSVSGRILHGTALGRQMGIRTVNMAYDGCLKNGVYATSTVIDGKKYKSITDIGYKPTVSSGDKRCFETHILDFSGDIYGCEATVIFLEYYREEKKFSSRQELTDTINKDIKRRSDNNE